MVWNNPLGLGLKSLQNLSTSWDMCNAKMIILGSINMLREVKQLFLLFTLTLTSTDVIQMESLKWLLAKEFESKNLMILDISLGSRSKTENFLW